MAGTFFKRGGWNIICDVCGQKFKNDQVQKRWDGLMVCKQDFETDHPQKFIRVRESGIAVPIIRERPEDVFIEVCTVWGRSAYADLATADCAAADEVTLPYALLAALKVDSEVPEGTFS